MRWSCVVVEMMTRSPRIWIRSRTRHALRLPPTDEKHVPHWQGQKSPGTGILRSKFHLEAGHVCMVVAGKYCLWMLMRMCHDYRASWYEAFRDCPSDRATTHLIPLPTGKIRYALLIREELQMLKRANEIRNGAFFSISVTSA